MGENVVDGGIEWCPDGTIRLYVGQYTTGTDYHRCISDGDTQPDQMALVLIGAARMSSSRLEAALQYVCPSAWWTWYTARSAAERTALHQGIRAQPTPPLPRVLTA